MRLSTISDIEARIRFIKVEIVMKDYSDGWTIEGLTDELHKLEEKLKSIKDD